MTKLNLLKVLLVFALSLIFFSCSDKEENASTGIDNTNVTPEMDVSCDPPCEEWCFDMSEMQCDFTFYWFYDCIEYDAPITLQAGKLYIEPTDPPCVNNPPWYYCQEYCLIPPCKECPDSDPECPVGFQIPGSSTIISPQPGDYTWYVDDHPSTTCCEPHDIKIEWNHTTKMFKIKCDI